MKTSLFVAAVSLLSAACSGAPFTVAEQADMTLAPDAGGLLAEPDTAQLPDAGPAAQPDAGPTAQPDAASTPQPDAGPTAQPDASPTTTTPEAAVAAVDAGAVAPDAAPAALQPDAAPAMLCVNVAEGSFSTSPTVLNFGLVEVGGQESLDVKVSNTGTCAAVIDTFFGRPQGELSATSACSTLLPGESCLIVVTFAPTVMGNVSTVGSVFILGQEYDYPITAGTKAPPAPTCQPGTTSGPFPQLAMAPTELDFGNVSVGGSKVLSSTLTNMGTCTTTLTAAGGAIPSGDYSVLSSCNAGKVLEPGDTCTVTVTFSPTNEREDDSVSAFQFDGQGFNIVVTGAGTP